ncbi:MAG TPA: hypothetical protein DCE41_16415 [Cytophagales bacterium]|nr:hypothetical protein [Cytophagales bacterium]HAA24330.1 hypothetical protein [Cytophagales bacterium]HAP63987.1 hypothetical protein [Cytophagales bacterium]
MNANTNRGYEPSRITELKKKMGEATYLVVESDDNSDEFVNFNFVGLFEGREVIYDAALYTLRMHFESEVYELAEHRAAQRFPEFKKIRYEEDENGDLKSLDGLEEEIGLFMTEAMWEIEEEEIVKVQEHLEIDTNLDEGIGLNAGLNVPVIDESVIEKFIKEYKEDILNLDDTFFSFALEEDEEEE